MSTSPTPPLLQGQFNTQAPAIAPSVSQMPAQSNEASEQVALEKQRCSLLLEINRDLLAEAMRLRNNKEATTAVEGSPAPQPPDEGFIECMRRLQANLAYLAGQADKAHKPGVQPPAHPNIMTAPPTVPSLQESYQKLLALFPGVKPVQSGKTRSAKTAVSNPGASGAPIST